MKKLMLIVLVASACSTSKDPVPVILGQADKGANQVFIADINHPAQAILFQWKPKKGYYVGRYAGYNTSLCSGSSCTGKNYALPSVTFTNYISSDGTYLWTRSIKETDQAYYFRYKIAGDSILFGYNSPFKVDSVWHFKAKNDNSIVFTRNKGSAKFNLYFSR